MGVAAELADRELAIWRPLAFEISGAMAQRLRNRIPGIVFNGHPDFRVSCILSVSIDGVRSQNLLHFLEDKGVLVSAGAACHSHSASQSHVLTAIGRKQDYATIRISISRQTSMEDAMTAVDRIVECVDHLRGGRPDAAGARQSLSERAR